MRARDACRDLVERALVREGWVITHESSDLGRTMLDDYSLAVLVFDPATEVIDRWIP